MVVPGGPAQRPHDESPAAGTPVREEAPTARPGAQQDADRSGSPSHPDQQHRSVIAQSAAAANLSSVLSEDRAARARRVFGSDLNYLTESDRLLIHAVTGEEIRQGQEPHERPLSAFAMQIAVDRRTGMLATGTAITLGYLLRTRDRLAELAVPANPFSGRTLTRARDYLEGRGERARSGEAP